jgi:small-conductance mechanosensitive channel
MEILGINIGFSEALTLYRSIRPILVFIFALIIYVAAREFAKRRLFAKARTKKLRHNITIFASILTYAFFIIGIMMVIFSYTGNIFSIGLTAGLLTAALGWALQRPITGIAGWIMVVVAKPFEIGDRIVVGGVKGDVANITLTHIYLKEFGGTIGGEETSGRIIMVPNSVLFEKDLINYTFQDDYILDEVSITVTYETNIEKAKEICIKAAKKITAQIKDTVYERYPKPYLRLNFQPSGIDVRIRFHAPADKRLEYNSKLTEEIFKGIVAENSVEFAYPHTEVIYREKKTKK